MSFKFAAAHLGQVPGEDAGSFNQFGPPAQATQPSTAAQSRDLTYGGKGRGSFAPARQSVSAADTKKAQEALAKAEAARAQEGIKRFFDDVVSQQFRRPEIVNSKAAFDAAGRLAADRSAKQKAYENAVGSVMRRVMESFARHPAAFDGNINPPGVAGTHDNRFTRFVLASKLSEVIRNGPYGSWVKSFDPSAFKKVTEDIRNNVRDSQFYNSAEIRQFDGFPAGDKISFFKSAAEGAGFPAAGFNSDRVVNMGPGAYQSLIAVAGPSGFSATAKTIETLVGNRLADVYGVPAGEVAALRRAAFFTPGVTGELYTGGRTATGRGAAFERGDYATKQESYRAVRERQNANLKKSEAEAALTLARKEAARVDQEKASADARGDTSEAARLEQERNALEQKAKEAAAKAAEAEAAARAAEAKAAESAAAASTSTTVSSGGAAMTAPSDGGGSSVTDAMTAPPAESLTPVVTTDSTGAPAVVVPDASVVAPALVVPAEKTSPVVALLAVAAIGGGIWWYMKNRKGA